MVRVKYDLKIKTIGTVLNSISTLIQNSPEVINVMQLIHMYGIDSMKREKDLKPFTI